MRKISNYNYNGPSMYPVFKPGDGIIINKDIGFEQLKKGDVVCFNSKSVHYNIVHRIVKKVPNGYITRGDNNRDCDEGILTVNLQPELVTFVRRGDKTIKVFGGFLGMLVHRKNLIRKYFMLYTRSPLKRILDIFEKTGFSIKFNYILKN